MITQFDTNLKRDVLGNISGFFSESSLA